MPSSSGTIAGNHAFTAGRSAANARSSAGVKETERNSGKHRTPSASRVPETSQCVAFRSSFKAPATRVFSLKSAANGRTMPSNWGRLPKITATRRSIPCSTSAVTGSVGITLGLRAVDVNRPGTHFKRLPGTAGAESRRACVAWRRPEQRVAYPPHRFSSASTLRRSGLPSLARNSLRSRS